MDKTQVKIAPTLGNSSHSYQIVRLKVNELERGKTYTEDAPHRRIPKSVVLPESIHKFHDLILAVKRAKESD